MTQSLSQHPEDSKILKKYRRNLLWLILVSSGIDIAIFTGELPLLAASLGSSLIIDEIIEWILSSLLAKNKIDLRKRFKIAGLIPFPGVTSLSIQALLELRKSYKKPEEVLQKMKELPA